MTSTPVDDRAGSTSDSEIDAPRRKTLSRASPRAASSGENKDRSVPESPSASSRPRSSAPVAAEKSSLYASGNDDSKLRARRDPTSSPNSATVAAVKSSRQEREASVRRRS